MQPSIIMRGREERDGKERRIDENEVRVGVRSRD
jgi:hypothetical protein